MTIPSSHPPTHHQITYPAMPASSDVLRSFVVWSVLIICVEFCEFITQKAEWVSKENIIQTIHLVLVFVYLILVGLCLPDSQHLMAALVVCIAWLDVSVALSYLLFGKWSSLGLYINMLLEVRYLCYVLCYIVHNIINHFYRLQRKFSSSSACISPPCSDSPSSSSSSRARTSVRSRRHSSDQSQ